MSIFLQNYVKDVQLFLNIPECCSLTFQQISDLIMLLCRRQQKVEKSSKIEEQTFYGKFGANVTLKKKHKKLSYQSLNFEKTSEKSPNFSLKIP